MPGDVGWVAVLGAALAWDLYALHTRRVETLSAACRRAVAHPTTRWPTVLAVVGLAKHLLLPNILPQLDPFWWLVERRPFPTMTEEVT